MRCSLFAGILFISIYSCRNTPKKLFSSLTPDSTGVFFDNKVTESDSLNILNSEYVYNGGGVVVGDFNGDGLQDLFFTGNQVQNKLYINLGHLKFKDVTEPAGLTKEGQWSMGASLVDINNDGKEDILVCNSFYKDPIRRKALLYVNQGNDKSGAPIFKEMARAYHLDDTAHNTNVVFFDYDHDGDLDALFITNVIQDYPNLFKKRKMDGSSPTTDRLFRNDWDAKLGHSVFTDVSKSAGITGEGYSHSVSIADINGDGWDDIYVSNDYLSNDLLYINNRNGTFTNRIDEYFKHESHSAMGNDIGDINNDGLPDIITTEMLPADNKRKKLMLGGNNYHDFALAEIYHYQYQYIRNTLQLNEGNTPGTNSHPVFGEIAMMAGVHETDWSWCPLFADFDNDGWPDLFVSNGFPKDVTDHDFASYRVSAAHMFATKNQTLSQIPVVKIPNYIFKNNRDLTFSDQTKAWGMNIPSFSNGAAYADLDNDGDLDLVVSNLDSTAFVFRNNSHELQLDTAAHYLRVQLRGPKENPHGIGGKVRLYYNGGKMQYKEMQITHGYLSTSEPILHFGLGRSKWVDSLVVEWPNRARQKITHVSANQVLTVRLSDAGPRLPSNVSQSSVFTLADSGHPLLLEVAQDAGLAFKHYDADFIDFDIQKTLPHKFSQYGPGLAVADVNGDGLDDLFIGGSFNRDGSLYLQNKVGKFSKSTFSETKTGKKGEDEGVLFFDADGDGDQDLYVAMGSYEQAENSPSYHDKFFVNDGQGNFTEDSTAFPTLLTSKSCVRATDYDGDGKLDIFIGGRVIPGRYPSPATSYILHNESKNRDHPIFSDVTSKICPELSAIGLISDALWTDFNNDGKPDLILAGEWMPITFLVQRNGHFVNITQQSGVGDEVGWWSSIVAGDFDNDGDTDYIVGNLGLNAAFQASRQQPVSVYAKDFDGNGSYDAFVETYVMDSTGQKHPYPYAKREDAVKQVLGIRRKAPKYADYGKMSLAALFPGDEMKDALIKRANYFSSVYLENKGNGRFVLHPLPVQAQVAPLYGMIATDLNHDGALDVLVAGNDYGCEVASGCFDAFYGLYLKGNGKGQFSTIPMDKSGFYLDGDAKGAVQLEGVNHSPLYIVSQNKGYLRCFRPIGHYNQRAVPLHSNDAFAIQKLRDGRRRKVEFYYGTTFLSESTRKLTIGDDVVESTIFAYDGKSRKVSP